MTVVLAAATTFAAPCRSEARRQQVIDSLNYGLSQAKTPQDSIPYLYDLFDIAAYADRYSTGDALFLTAVRAGNEKIQMEMSFRLADIAMTMFDPELTASMLDRIASLPDSEDKEIVECYIRSCIAPARKLTTEQDLSNEIHRLLADLNDPKKTENYTKFDRIARMFSLADYLQGYTQGAMLTEFMEQLEAEISSISHPRVSILRNKFYATSAMLYMRNEELEKAVNADRKILSIIDTLEEENLKSGRKFRNYDIFRFVSYRRLLKCYNALTDAEAQEYYDKIMELAKINQDIADDISVNPVPQMALHMKRGEYEQAVPLLQILVDNAGSLYEKKYYLRRLKFAAEQTGNHEMLAKAAIEYANILEEYTDLKTAERMRELQVNYNYQSLRDSNAEALKSREKIVTILAIAVSVLLILVVVAAIWLTARLTSGKRKLALANETLRKEGEELRETTESLSAARDKASKAVTEKTQLVNYITNEVLNPINSIIEYSQMIVDNAQGENKRYLERFKSVVSMNIRMLQGLLADVQELAVAESGTLPINRTPADLNAIGRMAADSISNQVNTGVKVRFNPANGGEKLIFNTDTRRVEIVLLNLLNNAAKFTLSGSITLSVGLDEEGNAVYTVTDTGCGIPADKAESIFNRFEKLDPDSKGAGLGLSICELVAHALDGKVELDTSYPGPGSRFVFTIYSHKS